MLYIETESMDASFHFSVEDYIVRHYPWDEQVLMIWQTDKCAMIGRNQIADAEVDMGFARSEGVSIVRRSSGGGTIYTDPGTLLFTVIQPGASDRYPLDIAKEDVASPVARALNKMGIPAEVEGRNDILIHGKKISGFAQYMQHGRLCTHGSLLYNADLEMLVKVLRVDDEKIRSKALQSVRSRVANIIEHMERALPLVEFKEQFRNSLFSDLEIREQQLTGFDLREIDSIYREKYGNPSWTFGHAPQFSFHNSSRFLGGKVEVCLDIVAGTVELCSIYGDFLGVEPIEGLEEIFKGKLFSYEAFSEALEGAALQPFLGSISKEELLSCFFG